VDILAISNRYPPWSLGGYEVLAADAVEALRSAGHRVRVLTTVADPSDRPAVSGDPDAYRELRWYWRDHRFPSLSLHATARLERANARVLRSHLHSFGPDAVLWWAMGGMSLSLLEQARRAGVAAAGVVCDDWMVYGPQVDRWTRLWRGRGRFAAAVAQRTTGVPAHLDLERAARWAFISSYTLQAARRAGLRLGGAVVAHAGIDHARFRFREPEPWRWRLLYCGRLDERKGVATAIEALARLAGPATLTIHGDGDRRYRDELRALAERLGVGERVRFQSSDHRDVPAVYAAADAVVFPVRWHEPWGLVPLEAMAIGRPVLASRAGGGAAEYLRDGENCIQFAPGDAAELATALERVAADATLRARLIEAGAQTAAQFTATAYHRAIERQLELAITGA
jgi:glycogen(starch) synthase